MKTILMTTKKGTQKDTRKVILVEVSTGKVLDKTDNVKGVIFCDSIRVGVGAYLKAGYLILSPKDLVIDPVHRIETIEYSELTKVEQEHFRTAVSNLQNYSKGAGFSIPASEHIPKEAPKDEVYGDLFKKDYVGEYIKKAFEELGVGVKVRKVNVGCAAHHSACKEAPKSTSAIEKMDEVSELFKSGKMTIEKFTEMFPEGNLVDFAKQLSAETGDPSFYNLATVLEALKPFKK